MGAITGTKVVLTALSGKYKILPLTATVASASDTITLTEADHGLTTISAIMGVVITSGQADTFQSVQVSYSGLVVTVVSKNAVGGAATTFGNITLVLLVS